MSQETTQMGDNIASAYEELKEIGAAPLWRFYGDLFRKEPLSKAVPYHWSYERFRRSIEFFTGVMSLKEAERRVLMMVNPGLQDPPATLTTLFAGLQTIMPGETARPHRHTSNAFRFIIDGTGATTTVNGEVVNRRSIGTPYRRAKGTPLALHRSIDVGRGFRAAGGVGRA